MVEYTMSRISLDAVFASLADATRRDILLRVVKAPRSISDLADAHPQMSFAAVAKHVSVLEDAFLIEKKREGRQQIVSANPKAIAAATKMLQKYEAIWESRFNTLEELLKE
jgi:DNA-binding transcriptional ArsR family regulator